MSCIRRLRRFLIEPELLMHLGWGTFRVTVNEIPRDAKIVSCSYDNPFHAFSIIIEHPSFDPIANGEIIPLHASPLITKIEDEKL